jgi:NAD dependent epimerase/dehydratase family enzyme
MGEMADAVLDSARVSAEKTRSTGFDFSFPRLPEALKDLLERKI